MRFGYRAKFFIPEYCVYTELFQVSFSEHVRRRSRVDWLFSKICYFGQPWNGSWSRWWWYTSECGDNGESIIASCCLQAILHVTI